ncbi:YdcF family protein [Rubripirellula reticaptiva]|uniref:DUF218 domain-containing protein n=1 Tax=Rubripirellula reticaptiva TaxID=2528013 RepID=A0A5C6F912_9BACT|nr:YdcF family protein [Rubripirellula reticaptiva]TWU57878.1 hypothetical protein Poly59_07870 [Rubripirellula reticaptiva]
MNNVQEPPPAFRALVRAALITFMITGGMVGLTYFVEGKTLATRAATSMAMPVGLAWIGSMLFTFWFTLRKQWSAGLAFGLIFALIYVTGNTYASSKFMTSVEWPEQTIPDTLAQPYRCAVVLGGGVMISPTGTAELGMDGERVFSAAQLFHADKISSIICTGATPDGLFNPCDVGRDLLLSAGIPDEAIFRILGENTTQEMQAMRDFLDNPPETFPADGEVILITSAFHMRRAMRLADKQDLDFVPYPCAFRTTVYDAFTPSRWVPTAESMGTFASALKERLAGLIGR